MKYGLKAGALFGLFFSVFLFSACILTRYLNPGLFYVFFCGTSMVLFTNYLPEKFVTPIMKKAVAARAPFLPFIISTLLVSSGFVASSTYICKIYVVVKPVANASPGIIALSFFIGYMCGMLFLRVSRVKTSKQP